jgi:ABC-type glycerol-3-phosphate transport system permease component
VAGAVYVVAFAAFVLLPVYWALTVTLGTPAAPADWRGLLPQHLTLDGYRFLGSAESWVALRNSAVVATVTAVVSVAIGLPAAYAATRVRRGGTALLGGLLALRLLPPVAVILPAFLLAHQYRMRDTLIALVVFYTPFTLTFTVLLGFVFFRRLPAELEEAARVDGCTTWQALRHIVAPLAAPAALAAAVLAFVFAWTEFFIAFVFFRKDALTLPLHVAYNATYACYGCVPPAPPVQLSLLGLLPSIAGGLLVYRFLERYARAGGQ